MVKKPVTIEKDMEKEDMPIAHLVQEASQYSSTVYFEVGSKKINAKSIMGMMSLRLQQGENIIVITDGKDETEAAAGVERFLAARG